MLKRFDPRLALLAALAGLTPVACTDTALLAPGTALDAPGRDDGSVTVPMTMDATMTWVVPGASPSDCPDLIDPETGELFTAEGSGEGEATHLGRFEITELDHPTINVCTLAQEPPEQPGIEDLLRDGTFELVASDGSALYGSYSFLFVPPEQGGFFTLYVEGGTQRLTGATGELHVNFEQSGEAQSSDPLFLGEVTLEPVVFEGEISVPRPQP